ncbi:MAG: hypothetical protein IJ113_01115 [Eggerthellaceae bacterium]|nr:hypothetical protein [Eggerthellaceae bacterium]
MMYIIGTDEQRKEFMDKHNIPFFEIEEQLDPEVVCLHNHDDEDATIYVDLDGESARYTVQSSENEMEFADYEEAIEAYDRETEIVRNGYGVEFNYDAAVGIMDEDIRERLHFEIAPCSHQKFFDAYCDAHKKHYGEEFELAKQNPTW